MNVALVPLTGPVRVRPAPFKAVAETDVLKDPVAPSIFPVTSPVILPIKAPSNVAADTVPEKTPDVPLTAPVNVKPVNAGEALT